MIDPRFKHIPWSATLILMSLITACSSEAPPASTASPSASPVETKSPAPSNSPAKSATPRPTPTSASADSELLRQAQESADSARVVADSAVAPADWDIVVSRLQQAIETLKSLPTDSPKQAEARKRITEYQKQLDEAKKKATPPEKPAASPKKQ